MGISQRFVDEALGAVTKEQIAAARDVDMLTLVDVELKSAAAGVEWEGPCPGCGGKDRLHVRRDGWFCRQCKPLDDQHGWHTPIDWVMWREHLSLGDAVKQLLQQARKMPVKCREMQPAPAPDIAWRRNAAKLCAAAAERLWADESKPGQDYLLGRGLEPHAWEQFGIGYAAHWHPDAKKELPAIVLPWMRGGAVVAVRFRFLEPPTNTKIVSLKGSRFAGLLFGGQGLPSYVYQPLPETLDGAVHCAEARSTLVLCEGELNALSIWQAAHNQRVDVLSLGSESAKLTEKSLAFAQRYGHVIVWMDKGEVADAIAEQLPGAARVQSPKGKDANDWLRLGRLGEMLAIMRWRAARDADARANVYWSIWDDAHGVQGIDTGTAKALREMSAGMGRAFDLAEPEPGRWVTQRWLEA